MDHTLEIKMKREGFCLGLPMVGLQRHIPELLHLPVSNTLCFVIHLGRNLMKKHQLGSGRRLPGRFVAVELTFNLRWMPVHYSAVKARTTKKVLSKGSVLGSWWGPKLWGIVYHDVTFAQYLMLCALWLWWFMWNVKLRKKTSCCMSGFFFVIQIKN